jgi:hypothetical protein
MKPLILKEIIKFEDIPHKYLYIVMNIDYDDPRFDDSHKIEKSELNSEDVYHESKIYNIPCYITNYDDNTRFEYISIRNLFFLSAKSCERYIRYDRMYSGTLSIIQDIHSLHSSESDKLDKKFGGFLAHKLSGISLNFD